MKNYLFWVLFTLSLASCTQKKTELVWNQSLHAIGTQSSPRATDLNGDGVLDIIMGAGKDELGDVDQGVFALDGLTGELLWQQKANAQVVGSATFYDITEDGIKDIFIGGRNAQLKALDGKTGAVIWEYQYRFEEDPILQYARYNFYNTVLVPDQNGDNIAELLAVNGGNWDAPPHSTEDRFPGVLMLINLKNGAIIAADTMPDGQESYMTPLCFSPPNGTELKIIFGSGGETASGSLYMASISDLKEKKLSNAIPIASEQGHGFIAPPSLADITQDGYPDIVAISHAGHTFAIDGKSLETLWERSFEGLESSNAFAVGHFNGDDVPDFLATLCEGTWPKYSANKQVVFDGKSGDLLYQGALGCFGISSPVVYDLNKDGVDEAILSINNYDCRMEFTEEMPAPTTISNQLIAIDFKNNRVQVIDETKDFRNIYSTPWIGDLDEDGYLDIVYSQNFNTANFTRFLGMVVKRISTSIRMKKTPKWGAYMGSEGNGIFAD